MTYAMVLFSDELLADGTAEMLTQVSTMAAMQYDALIAGTGEQQKSKLKSSASAFCKQWDAICQFPRLRASVSSREHTEMQAPWCAEPEGCL
jgi:hypothetical protein